MMGSTEDHRSLPRYDYLSSSALLNPTSSCHQTTFQSTTTAHSNNNAMSSGLAPAQSRAPHLHQPSLEEVLSDREALDCFRAWIGDDPSRSIDNLDLYFAIVGFKNAVNSGESNVFTIARELHIRFISAKTGSCDFIPPATRVDMSNKIHSFGRNQVTPPHHLFDQIQNMALQELRKQYGLFVCSSQYADFVTRYANGFGTIPPIDDEDFNGHHYVNEETFEEMAPRHHTTTIASSSVVGSSIIDDECQPSTSSYLQFHQQRHKNSNKMMGAMDDSLSLLKISPTNNVMTKSEPNVAQKFRLNRGLVDSSTEDQFAGCATTLNRKHKKDGKENRRNREHRNAQQHSGMPHDRPEQRLEFANTLSQKLAAISDEIGILEKQFGKVIYAREVPEYRSMVANGQHPSHLQHTQPPYVNQVSFANGWSQPLPQGMTQSYHGFTDGSMTGTALAVAATSGFDADEEEEDLTRYEQRLQQVNLDRSNSISPAPFAAPKAPRDRHFSPYGNGGFAPPPQTSTGKKHAQFDVRQHQQQPHGFLYGNGYLPQSSAVSHLSFSDSSGVFSAESAHVAAPIDQFKMKKLFEKARETNAMSNNASQTLMRKNMCNIQQQQAQVNNMHQSQTLPRPPKSAMAEVSPNTLGQKLIVSLREPGQMPFVSKCEPKPLTFKEFRRLFGISSRSTKRIFFKSVSEDGTDPYQWTSIERDDQIVPQFEGKITAECRTMSDSD